DRLADLTGAQAACADADAAVASVFLDDADTLEIGQPDLLSHVVGVADHVAESGTLLTAFTDTRHGVLSRKPRIVATPGRRVNPSLPGRRAGRSPDIRNP